MSKVNKYQIYCNTEAAYVYYWNTSPQTVCPNNNTHSVNINSNSIIHTVASNNVTVLEESTPTGGNYKSVCYKLDCTTGLSSHDYSFPYPISALSISFNTSSDNQNDDLEVIIGPETTIGVLTAAVSSTDTVFTVSSTVIAYLNIGFFITLNDGTNKDDCGVVTNIDSVNSQITVNTAAINGFAIGTPVQMSVKVIDNFTIGYSGRCVLGDSKIGGSYVPTGTIVRVNYTNNGVSTKSFYPVIEYLY